MLVDWFKNLNDDSIKQIIIDDFNKFNNNNLLSLINYNIQFNNIIPFLKNKFIFNLII